MNSISIILLLICSSLSIPGALITEVHSRGWVEGQMTTFVIDPSTGGTFNLSGTLPGNSSTATAQISGTSDSTLITYATDFSSTFQGSAANLLIWARLGSTAYDFSGFTEGLPFQGGHSFHIQIYDIRRDHILFDLAKRTGSNPILNVDDSVDVVWSTGGSSGVLPWGEYLFSITHSLSSLNVVPLEIPNHATGDFSLSLVSLPDSGAIWFLLIFAVVMLFSLERWLRAKWS